MRSTEYEQKTRAGNPKNPAKLLYAHWHGVLKACIEIEPGKKDAIHFGRSEHYGIGVNNFDSNDHPEISFGPVWGSVGESFTVNADGEFRISAPHGVNQRNILAKETFLSWGWCRRDYLWFYNPDPTRRYHPNEFVDWRNPIHYICERTMQTRTSASPRTFQRPWMRLVPEPDAADGWKIAFSRDKPCSTVATPTMAHDFEKYERLRQRRYRLMERKELIESGAISAPTPRTRLTEEQIEDRREKHVKLLTAKFNINEPARTIKPLRKTREEGLWELHGCP